MEKKQAERGRADVCWLTLPVTGKRESVAHCLLLSLLSSFTNTHTHTHPYTHILYIYTNM